MKSNFKKKILDNGMTVLFEKRDLPVVSVAFAVRAGGINESLDEKGISHFIEHMVFKGTEKRNASQIVSEIEKRGGEINAFTSEEITAFYCKMPSDHLNIALDVLGDVVKNPRFDEKELEKERQVIFEEMKLYKDTPHAYVLDEIQKCLYGGSLSVDLIGTVDSMNSINRNKMKEKFSEIYHPNQMILCVVGDADFEEVVKFTENNFLDGKGEIPEQEISIKNEIKIEERNGIDQANLVFAYHVPNLSSDKGYVARVLSALSAEGMSSRLFSEIREKRNLAYTVGGSNNANKRYAYNYVFVGTMKENVEKVKSLILEEFDKISRDLSEEELSAVKRQLTGQHDISMENSQVQLVNLIASEVRSSADDFYDFSVNVDSVSVEDVKEMASKVIDGSYSFFALVPSKNS